MIKIINEAHHVFRKDLSVENDASRFVIYAIATEHHEGPTIVREVLIVQFLVELCNQQIHAVVQPHVAIAVLRLDDEYHVGRLRHFVALQSLEITLGYLTAVYHGARGASVGYSQVSVVEHTRLHV